MDKAILRKWLRAGYVDQGALFVTEAGTPRGGILSPVLANGTLDGLEEVVYASVAATARQRQVVRYADDVIVTGATQAVLHHQVRPAIVAFLKQRGLELSDE